MLWLYMALLSPWEEANPDLSGDMEPELLVVRTASTQTRTPAHTLPHSTPI